MDARAVDDDGGREARRLAELAAYRIMDTEREEAFDQLVRAAGMDGYLPKPVRPGDLATTLAEMAPRVHR